MHCVLCMPTPLFPCVWRARPASLCLLKLVFGKVALSTPPFLACSLMDCTGLLHCIAQMRALYYMGAAVCLTCNMPMMSICLRYHLKAFSASLHVPIPFVLPLAWL